MKIEDQKEHIEHYERMFKRHAFSHEALGWGKHGRQDVRFSVLANGVLKNPGSSVLDVGSSTVCG